MRNLEASAVHSQEGEQMQSALETSPSQEAPRVVSAGERELPLQLGGVVSKREKTHEVSPWRAKGRTISIDNEVGDS